MRQWLRANWYWVIVDVAIALVAAFLLLRYVVPLVGPRQAELPPAEPVDVEALRASGPQSPEAWEQALTDSITAAGDYLVRYQLSNGELPYQVDVTTGSRDGSVSMIRMVAGAGSLYTVCRVTGDESYCAAGDVSLARYLDQNVEVEGVPGVCFYSRGRCTLGGDGIAIDAIYKRWQATGSTDLDGDDLLATATQLGENIAWLRNEDGGLIHSFDPHFGGAVDETYYVPFFPGESLMGLLELYEMTGDRRWLGEARETNAYMLQQGVTSDHWHGYGFALFARLDALTEKDIAYANEIGHFVLDAQDSLNTRSTGIATATRVEALASLVLALNEQGEPYEWLMPGLESYSLFVLSHQLPDTFECDWGPADVSRFEGGIFTSCIDSTVRIDGNQHWINGATAYLEVLHQTSGGA